MAFNLKKTEEENSDKKKQTMAELKEIYLQPDCIRKCTKAKVNDHIDPHTHGNPLDYSFRRVSNLSKLEFGTPREYRVGIPKTSRSGKFVSSSLWVNYNNLTNISTLSSLLQVSFQKPEAIAWLDFSFNEIEFISLEINLCKNLKILYFHGNKIKFFIEVAKLKPLKKLRTLTFHGNPIEEHPNYRTMVTKMLPQIVNFDFSLVSKY